MKSKWNLMAAAGSILLLVLSGCGPSGGTPTCATASLQAPLLASPALWGVVDSLSPSLSWTYPDSTCNPQGYAIHLESGPFFTDSLGGGTGNPSTSWSPGSPLQPAGEYNWTVQAINGSSLGPVSTNRFFFTGPLCDPAVTQIQYATLLQPADGAVINTLQPALIWQYPFGCLSKSYRVDLSTDPTFADTSLSGATGNPSTRWYPGDPLADCTTYFWKVRPFNDSSLGPVSEIWTFRTNASGTCAAEAPAIVRGVLWFDQCPLAADTLPIPNPLPAGCIVDGWGIDADAIHQAGEPPILGVPVKVYSPNYFGTVVASAVTNMNGMYQISLPPGKYALTIDADLYPQFLGDTHWTSPKGLALADRQIYLAAGQILTGQDFGRYQFIGSTPTPVGPSPTPVLPTFTPTHVPLSFTPNINAYCRFGPDISFSSIDIAMTGQAYLMDGRNLEGTWYRIMISASAGCWVPAGTGMPSGDTSGLRVLLDVPTPTPTLVFSCASYGDEKSCELNPACQWVPASPARGGYCR